MRKGSFFLVIEGIEGAGKTTQARLLERRLKKEGYEVCRIREPGGTSLSERIRKLLLHSKDEISPEAELCLYLSARAQLIHEVIKPALSEGKWVIADRYLYSTIAYQGYGRGLPLSEVKRFTLFIAGKFSPDIAFLIDLPPEIGLKRVKRKDRFESLELSFHRKVRKGYLDIAREFKMEIVDGRKGIDEISEIIFNFAMEAWKKKWNL